MSGAASTVMAIYGVLLVVGGGIGWQKAHSIWSLITGIVTGLLMFVAVGLFKSNARNATNLGLVVSGALSLFFLSDVVKTHKPMPGGGMFIISAAVAIFLWRAATAAH